MSYIGLHQHSTYSLLDGYARIPDLVKRSKELGWCATAITDHNHLLGIPDFQQECQKQGIKPLLGIEMYYTFDTSILSAPLEQRHRLAERDAMVIGGYTREDIVRLSKSDLVQLHRQFGYDTFGYHILFIAKNQQGWNNLVKLQSESSRLCTFNGRYHCDLKLLKKYHEGIICTTACIASFSSRMLHNGHVWMAKHYLTSLHQIFGEDFYLEIQPYNVRQQHKTNLFYHDWGEHNGVKTVATNDSHWVDREDALEHDVLLCIGTGEKQSNYERMHYEPVFWMRSEEEMQDAFEEQAASMTDGKMPGFTQIKKNEYLAYCYKALQNTQEVADKVEPDIRFSSNTYLFPSVEIEKGKTPEQVLRESAEQGLERYLEKNKDLDIKVYKDRLEEELSLICSKGFAPYFLTVQEFISWCDANNIPTGPGRGSAAGSLTLLCLGVTKVVDPIKTKLWFSRFITRDRKDMPD